MTATLTPASTIDTEAAPELTDEDKDAADRAEINPCPVCGKHQHQGPEKDAWTALHCWKCGYRPRQRVTANLVSARPVDLEKVVAELKAGVVEDILAALHQGTVPTVTIQPNDTVTPTEEVVQ